LGLGGIQAHQQLPAFDLITVAHQQVLNNAPLQVLDGLAIALHVYRTRRDGRGG